MYTALGRLAGQRPRRDRFIRRPSQPNTPLVVRRAAAHQTQKEAQPWATNDPVDKQSPTIQ
eukprot:1724211-Alexandrium_andersonii.AAC.1